MRLPSSRGAMATVVKYPRLVLAAAVVLPIVFSGVGVTQLELNDLQGWAVTTSYSARAYDAYAVAVAAVDAANSEAAGAPTRTETADSYLDLYWVSQRDVQDFLAAPEDLYYIRDLEASLLARDDIRSVCLLANATEDACLDAYSATAYLPASINDYDRDAFASDLLANPGATSFFVSSAFDLEATDPAAVVMPMVRSRIRFGVPLEGYENAQDRASDQEDAILEIIQDVALDYLDPLREANAGLVFYFDFPDITSFYAFTTIISDAAYAGAAIAIVFAMLCSHTGSLFLGISALFQILMSFPTAYFVYRFIAGIKHFGTLQTLAIFLVLGIGTDDIFIFWDAFQQSAVVFAAQASNPSILVDRLAWSFRKAAGAMLVTSLTTFVAFLVTALSPIPNIKDFGMFAALLILINFLMVISIFPCLVIIHERFVKQYRPLMCFCWCWNKARAPAPAAEAGPPKLGRVELFFRSRWIPLILRVRWAILFVGLALTVSFGALASRFKPGTKRIEDIFAEDHPLTIVNSLKLEEFIFSSSAFYTSRVVFGLELIDRAGTSPFDPTDVGTLLYSEGFAPLETEAQQALLDLCADFGDISGANRPEYVRPSTSSDSSVACWISAWKAWLDAEGETFPVATPAQARDLLEQWFASGDEPAEDFVGSLYGLSAGAGVVPDPITLMSIQVVLAVPQSAALGEKISGFEALASGLSERFAAVPAAVGTALVVSEDYVVLSMQEVLVRTAIIGLCAGIGFGFLCLLAMTRNVRVSVLATANILVVTALVLGTMQLSLGEIGFMEAISITALVGLSFDFTLHFAIAYVEFEPEHAALIGGVTPEDCQPGDFYEAPDGTMVASSILRTRIAFTRISVSVLFGAITSTTAAIALTLCEIQYLGLFGKFLLQVVVYSLVTSNTILPALLMTFGPQAPPRRAGPSKVALEGALAA